MSNFRNFLGAWFTNGMMLTTFVTACGQARGSGALVPTQCPQASVPASPRRANGLLPTMPYDCPCAFAKNPAVAATLFDAGRALLEQGKYELACENFEESSQLDPKPGTDLSLALCRERQGRTATAWAYYKQAATLARIRDHHEQYEIATESAKRLEATLSHLTIHIVEPVPGLKITYDNIPMGQAQFDIALPVDPGQHLITVVGGEYGNTNIPILIRENGDQTVLIMHGQHYPAEKIP